MEKALLGGALIGLAATLLLSLSGRVAGISGILGGALFSPPRDRIWRLSFVLGLIASGVAFTFYDPSAFSNLSGRSQGVIAIAGLLVGFGTRLGGGCTSGHGICGVGRFSRRSIAATLMFMFLGLVTATSLSAWWFK